MTAHPKSPSILRSARGFSLVELMIAITLGLLIVAALLALFLNITRTNNEMAKANSQIENGRFAIQILQNDLVHAGFWGELRPVAATAILPDPCVIPVTKPDTDNFLAMPVQGYADGSALAACGVTGVLTSSDVLVVRHANTCTWGSANCDGGADTGPHIQVSSCTTTPPEAAYVIDTAAFPLRVKDCATIAARRKVVSNIYYLANRTSNSCAPDTTCPSLMRVALVNGAYQGAQPLIEGVEAFHVEYGIDTSGDGSPDSYVSCAPCDLTQLPNIVAAKIYVLARSLQKTPGYSDTKDYQLGTTTIPASGLDDGYKRHVFSSTIRLVNPSSRRETP